MAAGLWLRGYAWGVGRPPRESTGGSTGWRPSGRRGRIGSEALAFLWSTASAGSAMLFTELEVALVLRLVQHLRNL